MGRCSNFMDGVDPVAAMRCRGLRRSSRPVHGDAGYSLVEVLIVLAILALLVGLAAPRLIGFLAGAKTDTASIQVKNLGGILDLYRLEVGRLPTEEEGLIALVEKPAQAENWNGPYLKDRDALTDPWGNPYVYRQPGEHGDYDLYSLGADGRDGGDGDDKDITSW